MNIDHNLGELQYKVAIYPNNIKTWQYIPRNVSELMKITDCYSNNSTDINVGIEISFDEWCDSNISKIGAMLITPAVFITESDFTILCRENFEDFISVDICGKDNLYLKFDHNKFINSDILKVVDQLKTQTEGFNCIYDVVSYCTKVSSTNSTSISVSDFRDIFFGNYELLLKDRKNAECYLIVYYLKMFSLYNPLMQDKEFLQNRNIGFAGLLSDSLFISTLSDTNYYSKSTINFFMRKLHAYLNYYTYIIENKVNNKDYDHIALIDHYSRFLIFEPLFIERNIDKIGMLVFYNESVYFVLESEKQIHRLKNTFDGSTDSYHILFTKNLDDLYKRSLLKAGAGGYDTIESVHIKKVTSY